MTHSHLPAYKVSHRPCLLPLLHRNSRAGAIVEATCWGKQCRPPAQIPVWLYETESICWFWFHYLKDNLLSCSDSTVGCLCYGYCTFPLLREICGQLSSGELDACKESKGCSLQSLYYWQRNPPAPCTSSVSALFWNLLSVNTSFTAAQTHHLPWVWQAWTCSPPLAEALSIDPHLRDS